MEQANSELAEITDIPSTPVELFEILKEIAPSKFLPFTVATIDKEFGVLDRTVVFRGLVDNCLSFVTEKNTRKYANLKEDPKISATMLLLNVPGHSKEMENWQVRVFQADAIELSDEHLNKLWAEEPVFARIRSYICECGKPSDRKALKAEHDRILKDYKRGLNKLERTSTYTAFKIDAKYWDFYMSRPNCIADRVQYRLQNDGKWEILHVDA